MAQPAALAGLAPSLVPQRVKKPAKKPATNASQEVEVDKLDGEEWVASSLDDLPFAYYCEPRLRNVLLPTLLCACFRDTVNLRILSSRLSPAHLLNFLRLNASPPPPSSAHPAAGGAADLPPTAYTPPAALIDDPSEL